MQRALNRAYLRLQGKHPKHPTSPAGWIRSRAVDAILVAAVGAVLSGGALIVLAFWGRFSLAEAIAGAGLVALAVPLLYLWERLAWEPFVDRLSKLT